MSGNSIGHLFRLTTFGESHGKAIGGIVDGCPAGLQLDLDQIQFQLNRRRPGQSHLTTQRNEKDQVEFLSGIFEGKTLGTPIAFVIRNEDQQSKDYSHLKETYRPNHADYTWQEKFGIRDYRGGGRASARETAARIVGGAIASQLLNEVQIHSFVSSIGKVNLSDQAILDYSKIDSSLVRCPDEKTSQDMVKAVEAARDAGDSLGGIVSGVIKNVPVGWGEPVFDKLHAQLGKALLSINAVKGVEFGSGFASASMKGSEMNDLFYQEAGEIKTQTNHSGGIQGGISNGSDITFRLAFKPVASIYKQQSTVNQAGEQVELQGKGRHDPCVVPRAVPIVDAMVALVLADHYLLSKSNKQ